MVDKILLQNILKIECHRYFDNSWRDYNKINKKIRTKTIINMLSAYLHRGKEVLLLMDNGSFKHKMNVGNYENVTISNEMKRFMNNSNSTFTAFHNHPKEGSFSLGDLEQIIIYDKIQLLVLCTNSCRYCAALYKPRSFTEKEIKAILTLFDSFKEKNNVDGHCNAKYFIQQLQEKGRLFYYETIISRNLE